MKLFYGMFKVDKGEMNEQQWLKETKLIAIKAKLDLIK